MICTRASIAARTTSLNGDGFASVQENSNEWILLSKNGTKYFPGSLIVTLWAVNLKGIRCSLISWSSAVCTWVLIPSVMRTTVIVLWVVMVASRLRLGAQQSDIYMSAGATNA